MINSKTCKRTFFPHIYHYKKDKKQSERQELEGPVGITVSVLDKGNLKGQILNITVQSLSESISSLKEKIAGEVQLPTNKQKPIGRGHASFL